MAFDKYFWICGMLFSGFRSVTGLDINTSCDVPSVYAGETARVTCHFNDDVNKFLDKVTVDRYNFTNTNGDKQPDHILECAWLAAKEPCRVREGFQFNQSLTSGRTLTLEIPSAGQGHAGSYVCNVVGSGTHHPCNFALKERDISPSYTTTTSSGQDSHSTIHMKPETLDNEGDDGDDSVAGAIAGGVVAVVVILVVVAATVIFKCGGFRSQCRSWNSTQPRGGNTHAHPDDPAENELMIAQNISQGNHVSTENTPHTAATSTVQDSNNTSADDCVQNGAAWSEPSVASVSGEVGVGSCEDLKETFVEFTDEEIMEADDTIETFTKEEIEDSIQYLQTGKR